MVRVETVVTLEQILQIRTRWNECDARFTSKVMILTKLQAKQCATGIEVSAGQPIHHLGELIDLLHPAS